MRLSTGDLRQLANVAVVAVTEAGALIAEFNGREVAVERKAGGESLASQVVTEVDERSQSVILKHLLPTCATYDLALLSEEQADDGGRLEEQAFGVSIRSMGLCRLRSRFPVMRFRLRWWLAMARR